MNRQPHSERGFLEDLGQRILTARSRRCISRKVLARASGISERYIAQVESGNGNVSILLLRRISNAMAVPLVDLIPIGKGNLRRDDVKRPVPLRANC